MRPGFQTSLAISSAGFYKEVTEILRFAQNDNPQEPEITQANLPNISMKRLFRIFELAKNEQRVVLIVMFVLIAFAFIGYQRRVHHPRVQLTSATEPKPSPSPVEIENNQ